MPEVVIVPTGTANIASVHGGIPAARRRAAGERERADVAEASHVMLPGVGTFGAAMQRLVEHGLDRALRERIAGGPPDHRHLRRPSAPVRDQRRESRRARARARPGPYRPVPRRCARAAVRLERGAARARDAALLEDGYAYFANSYRATEAPGWAVAQADPRRPVRGRHGARQRHRLPVPPRALGRLWRGAAGAVPGAGLMLTSRIIPCLDVSHGRVVKGVRFQGLRDAGDPAERARLYQDTGRRRDRHPGRLRHARGQGAPARDGPPGARGAVDPAHRRRRRARGRGRLAPAGGRRGQGFGQHGGRRAARDPLRHRRAVRSAVLRGGDRRRLAGRPRRGAGQGRARGHRDRCDRVGARGRAARGRRGAADLLGPRRHPLGLRSGADRRRGASRARAGDRLGRRRSAEHIREAFVAGADAVLAASIFHDGDTTPNDIKLYLQEHGIRVRP